jgi:hypothetical protein
MILLILATLTNFRLYQIVFSSLCDIRLFKTKLTNLSKLTPLNLLNCANILGSLLAIIGASLICTESNIYQSVFLVSITCIAITVINIMATLLAFVKD